MDTTYPRAADAWAAVSTGSSAQQANLSLAWDTRMAPNWGRTWTV